MKSKGFRNIYFVSIIALIITLCASFVFVPTETKAAISLELETDSSGAYLVSSFEDLEHLSEYVYTGGSTSSKTFKLTNNIDMKSQSFIPIGTIYNGSPFYFDRTLDGQGYTILNLNIDTNSTYAAGDLGIIGYLNGTVKNLSVLYGSVYLSTTDKSAGGIVGSMFGSAKVERCYNLGTKVYTYSGARSFNIGGVVGYQDSSSCTVTQCYNLGVVDNNGRSTARAGGIVGNALGNISECFNNGTITSGTTSATLTYAGGITGQGGTIKNCFNKGSVTAQAKSNTITDSNKHEINAGDTVQYLYEGYGYYQGGRQTEYKWIITYVEDKIGSTYGTKREAYAGGISGYTGTTINYCYNFANISGGYSNIKYTIHYVFGAQSLQSTYFYGDYYQTTINENVSFANSIANGCSFNYCYANKNTDSSGNSFYTCNYNVTQEAIQVSPRDTIYGNTFNYIQAILDNKYTIFNCGAHGFHSPKNNPHPTGKYSKSFSNTSSANYTQKVNTYYYCAPYLGGENVRDAGLQNCRVSITNNKTGSNRSITINFLYDRYDIIEVPAAPDKDDDLGFADVIPFGGSDTKLEEQKRNQDYDGNKAKITITNNFVRKPSYAGTRVLTSVPSTFSTSIWGVNSLINNANPYLRCFYWTDSAQSFNN